MKHLSFEHRPPPGGYAWWYFDVASDDHQHGMTVIFFYGSVFSPRYRRARKRGSPDPMDFCAVNVALYGPKNRWVFSEYPASQVKTSQHQLSIGENRWDYDKTGFKLDIADYQKPMGLPAFRPFSAKVHFEAKATHDCPFTLDTQAHHKWWPKAPSGRAEVEVEALNLHFSGRAYHDSNFGNLPLEHSFQHWSWCRSIGEARPKIYYDVVERGGEVRNLCLQHDGTQMTETAAPPFQNAGRGLFGLRRHVRSQTTPKLKMRWEDSPFYTRDLFAITDNHQEVSVVHEHVNLQRFVWPLTQWMLPFRISTRPLSRPLPTALGGKE